MNYSTLSTAAIGFALVALTVAGAAAILACLRRRQWADRALTLTVVALIGAAASALLAAGESQRDLQAPARRVLSLAASAERSMDARSGRYTYSIARLERLSPALAFEIRDEDASVQASINARTRSVRLQGSLGFGTIAELTLRSARPLLGQDP
jgi:hypothetical protein